MIGDMGQCEPTKVTEVSAGLNQLNDSIETLHKELTRLGERLLPVITPKIENAKSSGEQPEPKRCDVAKVIYEDAKKIQVLISLIRDLIKGLEV